MTLMVQVLTPNGSVWSAIAQSVILPSTTGNCGVLRGHIPITTFIDTGVMRIREGQEWTTIAVMNGFAQVRDDHVLVLVNAAERGDEIDAAAARADLQAAEAIVTQGGDRREQVKALQAMRRAKVRLAAATAG